VPDGRRVSWYRNHQGVCDDLAFKQALTEHLKKRGAPVVTGDDGQAKISITIEMLALLLYKLEVRFRFKLKDAPEVFNVQVGCYVVHVCRYPY
jgi:hypothetical protein